MRRPSTSPIPDIAALREATKQLATHARHWENAFDPDALNRYRVSMNNQLRYAVSLARRMPEWRRDVGAAHLHRLFALNRSGHAFDMPSLDWGVSLHEPQITRALAHLLSAGTNPLRAQRISAFLHALEQTDAVVDDLLTCRVTAEEGRIDLKLEWTASNGRACATIIEAKFEYRLTTGQLSKYRKDTVRFLPAGKPDCVLLALDDSVKNGLHQKQRDIWRFVPWRDLWLRFEELRPEENNPDLSQFMKTLWRRIGGLKQGK